MEEYWNTKVKDEICKVLESLYYVNVYRNVSGLIERGSKVVCEKVSWQKREQPQWK